MRGILCLVLIGCSLIISANGYTFSSQTDPDVVHGKLVFYCQYKGVKLLPKSRVIDYDDCTKCKCDKGGSLNCDSIQETLSYDKAATKCTDVSIGCKNKWVLKKDTTKKCPKKMQPKNVSAVGK